MFYNNCCLCFIFLFSAFFILAEDEGLPVVVFLAISELELRREFLEKGPNSFTDMINDHGMENGKIVQGSHSGTFSQNEARRNSSRGGSDYTWSNKSETVNIGTGSTGNVFLDLLPGPAKSVVVAVKILKSLRQGPSWIKKIFGIRPPMTVQACLCIIKKNPYTKILFDRVQNINHLIQEVNSNDIVTRITARIKLLEMELPPPYNKRFKKAIKKFKKECANAEGELVGNQEIIKVHKIFNSYLKEMLIVPENFIKYIPKLKKHKNYQPKKDIESKGNSDIINLIATESKMSFPRLVRFCKKHGSRIITELYKHFVKKRAQRAQQQIQKDPEWKANPNDKSIEQQTKLLLRSYYQKELESWVSNNNIDKNQARDETYHALDKAGLLENLPEGYHFNLLDNFIQNICKGIDNCTPEVIQFFFHNSGVLKKFESNSFIQKYICNKKLTSSRLHRSVNYALAIQEKVKTPVVKIACSEILYNSALALYSVDEKKIKAYEENAYNLYRQIVEKKGKLSLNQVDAGLIKEFESLIVNA